MSMYNTKEIADLLDINEETVRRWIRSSQTYQKLRIFHKFFKFFITKSFHSKSFMPYNNLFYIPFIMSKMH